MVDIDKPFAVYPAKKGGIQFIFKIDQGIVQEEWLGLIVNYKA
jgi:hypothetical protein